MSIFVPDIIYGPQASESERRSWLSRQFEALRRWSQAQPEPEVITYGAQITDDAGDGTPHGDLNATDFTGHDYAEGTALRIETNALVSFAHKNVAYKWVGPSGVLVGQGGNYIAVADNLVPLGTNDHSILVNRDVANAHPTAAITGLDAKQTEQDTNITTNANTISSHISAPTDAHAMAAITGLVADQQRQDDALQAHINATDPHPQYVIEGYGGLTKATDTNYGTVGSGAWTTIDNWDAGMVPNPVGVVQDVANSGLRIEAAGKYRFTGNFAISFTDTNQGRVFGVRLFDATSGTPGRVVDYFVGRNQDGVNIAQGSLIVDIATPDVGDLLQIQIAGSGDSFSNVAVIDALFSVARVG